MIPEEINLKIAKACGWKRTPHLDKVVAFGKYLGDDEIEEMWECNGVLKTTAQLDFYNDLNAMAEAEKTLTVKQQWAYAKEIGNIIFNGELSVPDLRDNWYMAFMMMSATSQQRAIAFFKVI